MRSSTRGRPPSESTEPASVTMPSLISSRITLLTEAVDRPVASLRSWRLHGWLENSDHRRTVRLSRRRSRTVQRFFSATVPLFPALISHLITRAVLRADRASRPPDAPPRPIAAAPTETAGLAHIFAQLTLSRWSPRGYRSCWICPYLSDI